MKNQWWISSSFTVCITYFFLRANEDILKALTTNLVKTRSHEPLEIVATTALSVVARSKPLPRKYGVRCSDALQNQFSNSHTLFIGSLTFPDRRFTMGARLFTIGPTARPLAAPHLADSCQYLLMFFFSDHCVFDPVCAGLVGQ